MMFRPGTRTPSTHTSYSPVWAAAGNTARARAVFGRSRESVQLIPAACAALLDGNEVVVVHKGNPPRAHDERALGLDWKGNN